MSTPIAAQIEALLNFLEEHRDLARGNLRCVEGRVRSQRLWEEICFALNAMGGCIKTIKQWQKLWTDKKYLAKKVAAAARRSAAATGGGPSTAPSLSQWELKVVAIMGDGFGQPQTSARIPAFVEHATPSITSEEPLHHTLSIQPNDGPLASLEETQHTEQGSQTTPARDASLTCNPINSTERQQRRSRRRSASFRTDSSVRDRLFQLEEHRRVLDEQKNAELAGIRMAIVELCELVQQFIQNNS